MMNISYKISLSKRWHLSIPWKISVRDSCSENNKQVRNINNSDYLFMKHTKMHKKNQILIIYIYSLYSDSGSLEAFSWATLAYVIEEVTTMTGYFHESRICFWIFAGANLTLLCQSQCLLPSLIIKLDNYKTSSFYVFVIFF